MNKFTFVSLVETWLDESEELSFQGYTVFRKCRQKHANALRNSGGITVFVADTVSEFVSLISTESNNILWLRVRVPVYHFSVFIGVVYYSPANSSSYADEPVFTMLEDDVYKFRSNEPDCRIIIQGDFNARTGNGCFKDYIVNDDPRYLPIDEDLDYVTDDAIEPRASRDTVMNKRGYALLNFCKSSDLRICNGRLFHDKGKGNITCYANNGQSVVDYVLCSDNAFELFDDFKVSDEVESTHLPITFSLSLTLNNNERAYNLLPKTRYRWNNKCLLEYLHNWDVLSADVVNQFHSCIDNGDVQGASSLFNTVMQSCASFCKSNTVLTNNVPKGENWYDGECKMARDTARRLLRVFQASNSKCDRERYVESVSHYKQLCVEKLSSSFSDYTNKISNALSNKDSKLFWRTVKSKSAFVNNNITPSDWVNHFKNVFQSSYSSATEENFYIFVKNFVDSISERLIDSSVDNDYLDKEISCQEIVNAIQEMHNGKAPGLSGIPIEFFKNAPYHCIDLLKSLFNSILSTGIYPTEWTYGVIIPLYKKGKLDDPGNYRPITLLEVTGKIFCKIINNRLHSWAEREEFFVDEQAGFRHGFQTQDNIFILNAIIGKYLSLYKGRLYCAFIDLKAAFDSVDRCGLLYKLWLGNIKGNTYRLLKNMYQNIKACVSMRDGYTHFFDCLSGVRQGCQLSPFLFSFSFFCQ